MCVYCTTKGLGPSTACNWGVSRWGQYSSYSVFYIQQLFNVLGCLFIIILFLRIQPKLYQEKLPSSSPCIPQHAHDVHSVTHHPCPKELIVKTGREPKARRGEVTHPKPGARAWSRAVLSWLLSQCPRDRTTPPLQGVWSVIMKDHVALVSFTVRAV